jgi:hypothetical protein
MRDWWFFNKYPDDGYEGKYDRWAFNLGGSMPWSLSLTWGKGHLQFYVGKWRLELFSSAPFALDEPAYFSITSYVKCKDGRWWSDDSFCQFTLWGRPQAA